MYEPYPTGAQLPESRRPLIPPSVASAVKVMYAGAAASIIGIVIDIATVNTTKSALEKKSPHLSVSQLNATQHTLVAGFIFSGVVAAALWVLIAVKCRAGQNWARLTGTVLFAVATINMLGTAIAPEAGLAKIWQAVVWLAGLAAVVLLWRRSSTEFFKGIAPS